MALKIVARKKPVVTLALGLAIVSMISTAILQSGEMVESASALVSKLVKPRQKLVYASDKCSECIRQCIVTLKAGNNVSSTTLTIIPEEVNVKGLPSKPGWVGVGYLLSKDLGIGKGDNITVEHEDKYFVLPVNGVYRTWSPLDTGITIVGAGYEWCSDASLVIREEAPTIFTQAFSRQVESLVSHWGVATLIVLGVGSLIASIKAYMDLEPESRTFLGEGGKWYQFTTGLALFLSTSILAGYGWGLVLTDVLNSLVGSATGLYIPRGPSSIHGIIEGALAPALLAGLITLATGLAYGHKRLAPSL